MISDEIYEELSAEVDISLTKEGYAAPIDDLLRAAESEPLRLALANYSGLIIEELTIEPGSPCAGKSVGEIPWPEGSIIASVHRGRQVIIPRGSTVISDGDVLVMVIHGDAVREVKRLCHAVRERE